MTRTSRTRGTAALLTGFLVVATACTGDDGSSGDPTAAGGADTETVLTTLADDVIIPTYEALRGSLGELRTAIDGLCEAPSADALAGARSSWADTQEAWGRSRTVMVGPATERRFMADVGYRARADDVEELVLGADPVGPQALAAQGTAVRGIYAVEVLLFAPASDALTSADGARRCTFASSAAQLSSEAAADVLADWTADDGYRATFIEGPDGDPQMSLATLVSDASFRLQEIDDLGVRDLVGAGSVEDVSGARRDGPSASRIEYLRSVLDGVTAVLIGPDGGGLQALLATRSADTTRRLTELVDEARTALADLPDAVADALTDQPAVSAAADAVAALKVLVTTEMASQLGVTIGFSDADGDS